MMINVVVSTGAGISAESGIHTYRDTDGLWTKYDSMEVSHIRGWRTNPAKVLEFKNELRRQFEAGNYKPNAAHYALTKLQKEWPHGEVLIVTQNIDGLHRDAGSKVLEMHGTGREKFCEKCGEQTPFDADITVDHVCVSCGAVGTTRPYVVMFGEMPCHVDYIEKCLDRCNIFIAIGTSLEVMPASLFASLALGNDAVTYYINKEQPRCGLSEFKHIRYGLATVEVPKLVDELLARYPKLDNNEG